MKKVKIQFVVSGEMADFWYKDKGKLTWTEYFLKKVPFKTKPKNYAEEGNISNYLEKQANERLAE